MMLRHLVSIVAISVALIGCGPGEPKTAGAPAGFRQLSEAQYRNIVADVFGPDIQIAGAFAPIPRTDGLMAVGSGRVAVTPSAFERYEKLARFVAAQVVNADNRPMLVPCAPAQGAVDEACARAFYAKTGRLLYRRPLTDAERDHLVALTSQVAKAGTFDDGLAAGVSAMLVAPDFLLIGDVIETDKSGAQRMTDYSKASRLSFFLWNAGPDDALLTAAEKGELASHAGLTKQAERMLQSPRVEAGVRALFSDMLMLEGAATLQKDPVIYPAFGMAASFDASEQTLRTIVDLMLTRDGNYRDLFTTRQTFLTRTLGVIYEVPVQKSLGWVPYTFPENDPHVGIQSYASLLALNSHPGRSSVTLRGKAVRELLLCQKVPDPPANVDFTLVSDSANPDFKTARQRVSAHSSDPSCAGCHKLMDPIGLSLENFDGAGQFRTVENGVTIDPSGELDGVAFQNPIQLGKALHDNTSATQCVVSRAFAYAAGRAPARDERQYVDYLHKRFADNGYRLKELLKDIATSDGLYAVGPGSPATRPQAAADAAKERS